jgi:hypothetical protein
MLTTRIDTRPIPERQELRAFLVVRDEIARLPDVFRHHRGLGIERFFVVDNGSSDGTLEFLQDQSDVQPAASVPLLASHSTQSTFLYFWNGGAGITGGRRKIPASVVTTPPA